MTSQSILYHNNLVQIKKAHKTSHKDKKNILLMGPYGAIKHKRLSWKK